MKAQIWERHVSDGFMDAIHGGHRPIIELFVPELNIAINEETYYFTKPDQYAPYTVATLPANLPNPRLIKEMDLLPEIIAAISTMAAGRKAYDAFREANPFQETSLFNVVSMLNEGGE